jgi:DTW domain-containing protein
MERWKPSNTARLAALALPRARLVDYGGPNDVLDEALLVAPGTALLYPDGPPAVPSPVSRLVVLDGSWPQARRMTQRIPPLRALPRLVLPPPDADLPRLRDAKLAEGMSTLAAIARALALLEGEDVARPLDTLLALVVERSRPG